MKHEVSYKCVTIWASIITVMHWGTRIVRHNHQAMSLLGIEQGAPESKYDREIPVSVTYLTTQPARHISREKKAGYTCATRQSRNNCIMYKGTHTLWRNQLFISQWRVEQVDREIPVMYWGTHSLWRNQQYLRLLWIDRSHSSSKRQSRNACIMY